MITNVSCPEINEVGSHIAMFFQPVKPPINGSQDYAV